MATHVIDADQLERELAELLEVEKFPPPKSSASRRWSRTTRSTRRPSATSRRFWAKQADELVDWFTEPTQA